MRSDAQELFERDAILRTEANELLAQSGIGAILTNAGYTLVGSYCMQTMMNRNLDFERVREPDWREHWEGGRSLP
jgi:hypothetical protein